MNTSFVGSRSGRPANQARRCFRTSARCCSSACAVFFYNAHPVRGRRTRQITEEEERSPRVGDQPLLDFQQRQVRLAAIEAEQVLPMGLDPLRPAIPRPSGTAKSHPLALKRATQRTALAMPTPKRLADALRDMPSSTTPLTTRSRRSCGKRHSRRLLCAGGNDESELDRSRESLCDFTLRGYRSRAVRNPRSRKDVIPVSSGEAAVSYQSQPELQRSACVARLSFRSPAMLCPAIRSRI